MIVPAHIDFDQAAEAVRRDALRVPAWLASARSQTLLGAFLPRLLPLPACEEMLVDTDPRTRVLCHCHFLPRPVCQTESSTALVIVHGLSGSSASGNVVDITRHALARGLHVVRMNMRNCGGTEHLTPTLYHTNMPQDLAAVVRSLVERGRVRRVVLAGYSAGGNLVINTLAHWGAEAPPEVVGAVVVCPSIDIAHCVSLVDRAGNELYRRYFVTELIRFYRRKAGLFRHPYDLARVRGVRTLREFDAAITAPHEGFDDVDAFYQWVSSVPRLARVTVPTLMIQALDDPVVQMLPSTRAQVLAHPALRLVESPSGGHCGFLELPSRLRPDGRWAAYQIARFAATLGAPDRARDAGTATAGRDLAPV
jgi:predicted alpha/beta-fold hydrolase